VTEARCDQAVPEEIFRMSSGDGWNVVKMDESMMGSWIDWFGAIELLP
jgi:hypothetical protein